MPAFILKIFNPLSSPERQEVWLHSGLRSHTLRSRRSNSNRTSR